MTKGGSGEKQKKDAPGEALTAREREIVQLVAEGQSSKEIADTLGISLKTIEPQPCRHAKGGHGKAEMDANIRLRPHELAEAISRIGETLPPEAPRRLDRGWRRLHGLLRFGEELRRRGWGGFVALGLGRARFR